MKLPKYVIKRLGEYHSDDDAWTVEDLRNGLKRFMTAQEVGERQTNLNQSYGNARENQERKRLYSSNSLLTVNAFTVGEKRKRLCIYCDSNHWSDEYKKYPDVKSRKEKLSGHCFIYLKRGHLLKDFQVDKTCVYCKRSKNHHRSLCPMQFRQNQLNENESSLNTTEDQTNNLTAKTKVIEDSLVAAGEKVIMQMALIEMINPEITEE